MKLRKEVQLNGQSGIPSEITTFHDHPINNVPSVGRVRCPRIDDDFSPSRSKLWAGLTSFIDECMNSQPDNPF